MKYRIIAAIVLSIFVLNLGGSTFADTRSRKSTASQLVHMLPTSDGVVTFNVKRSFNDALPKLLAGNQPLLSKINGKIEEFQAKTGVDIRQFDDVAVGVTTRQIGPKQYDVDPVVIARGQTSTATLINAAKAAVDGKQREERVGDRVMYVFEAKDAAKIAPKAKALDKMAEVAVAAIDDKTLAFGEVERVRATLEAKTKVASELVVMLEKNPTSAATFAARPPAGLKAFLPLENDELGKNIDSIQYLYGAADVGADNATVRMTARTSQNAQAKSLFDTLDGLQALGKVFLGGAKGDDKKVYARLVDSAKFSLKANEVSFDLTVPQNDIDFLVGLIK